MPRAAVGSALAIFTALLLIGASLQVSRDNDAGPAADVARERFGNLPLAFVPNRGQSASEVRYHVRDSRTAFYFTDRKAVIALEGGEQGYALELRFLGTRRGVEPRGFGAASGSVNYLGAGQARSHLPAYRALVYRSLWPGIDMVFRGSSGQLKYEFIVHPGADSSDIHLGYAGADGLAVTRSGSLAVQTPVGELTDAKPRSYQRIGDRRMPVQSRFIMDGNGRKTFSMGVGAHDPTHTLVIDPGLVYSTFLGGTGSEAGEERTPIAVDRDGNAYIAGNTGSGDFPTTPGAFQTGDPGRSNAYVTKLSADGSSLVWSTYLGGSSTERANAIAVDRDGSAYVTGLTNSADFPTTLGAFDTSPGELDDAYVAKLSPDGSSLVYSTYLSTNGGDQAYAIAVDSEGSAYVVGHTTSAEFPTSPGAYDSTLNGGADDVVVKLNPAGSALVFSTYLGGGEFDQPLGLAIDWSGNAYVTGSTSSPDFPVTPGAFDNTYPGSQFAGYVTKLTSDGTSLGYSTFLGGTEADGARSIAVDRLGNAYVTGFAFSADFPTTAGAFQPTMRGPDDAFVTKIDALGSGLLYSTYLGGSSGGDEGRDITVDSVGRAVVTGDTFRGDFPTTPDAFDPTHNGSWDAFVTVLAPTGASLVYSSLLGGSFFDTGSSVALDGGTGVYLSGVTNSSEYPTTPGAFDTSHNGGNFDAFATKLDIPALTGQPASLALSPESAQNSVGSEHCVVARVSDAAGHPIPNVNVVFRVDGAQNGSAESRTDQQGEARFCYAGELLGTDRIDAVADFDPEDGSASPGEPADTASKTWVPPDVRPCVVKIWDRGSIRTPDGTKASFTGHAHQKRSGEVSGRQAYTDLGAIEPVVMSSTAHRLIICSEGGKAASVLGDATVNGQGPVAFRIDLADNGRRRGDTYRIRLSTGYDSGTQVLEDGDVRVVVR